MIREKYVMLGHSHVIGDLIEIIHGNHGILMKIIQNVSEIPYKDRPSLKQRLERLRDPSLNRRKVNRLYSVCVERLDEFTPRKEERYIVGFTGFKMLKLVQYLDQTFDIRCASLVHPTAVVAPEAYIPPGCIIQAGVLIASGAHLEAHAFINKGVNIGAHAKIGRFSSLGPGVIVGQNADIKTGVALGIGSVISDGVVVHEHATVAAGATVFDNVPSNTLVAGTPAIIKKTYPSQYKTI